MSIILNSFRFYQETSADGAPEFFGVIPNITAVIDAGSFTYDVAQHYSNNPTSYALQNEPTTMDIDSGGLLTYTPTIEENIGGIIVTGTNAEGFAVSNVFSAVAQIDTTIIIDGFETTSEPDWVLTHGSSIDVTLTFGVIVDYGYPEETVEIYHDKTDDSSSWVNLTRTNIVPEASWADAVYIEVEFLPSREISWWMSLRITAGGVDYDVEITPYQYVTGFFQNRVFKLSDISVNLKPEEITGLRLAQAGQTDSTLYWNKVALLREVEVTPTVIFTTNEASKNIFEPGSSVNLIFTIGALGILAGAVKLEYEIYNYLGLLVENDEIVLDGSSAYQVSAASTDTGYYEVIAYWIDSSGDRMEIKSCVEPKGSIIDGKGTYAVVASTIAESSARITEVGNATFFGLHLSHQGLGSLVGIDWTITAPRWENAEPTEPTYVDGVAQWAYDALQEPAGSGDGKRILTMSMNLYKHLPAWVATSSTDPAPAMNDVEDYYRYLSDRVKVHVHEFPDLSPRIYNIFWEVNLNAADGIRTPIWNVADVKEAYRRARLVLDVDDPAGLLCGPGPNSYIKDFSWVQEQATGDVFQYLDGFHGHGYNSSPEGGGVREKTRDLKTLFASEGIANAPTYVTELGYVSLFGTVDQQSNQAKLHIRCAIILKGEHVTVYSPFYSYDLNTEAWGFTYNLDDGLPFSPSETSPKSVVPAYSVCVKELEGATPVRDITTYGTDIWCYVFNGLDAEPVIVIWTIGSNQVLDITVGAVSTVVVTDFMGADVIENVTNEIISIYITDAPVYIKGATWVAVGGMS